MQGQVEVAPARWWHVPGLSRLIRETRRKRAAGLGGAVVWASRWSPSLGLLQSVWPAPVPGLPGPRSVVAERDGRPVGLAQMKPRREPRHWEVVYLAVEAPAGPPGGGEEDGPAPLWLMPDRKAARLLGGLCDGGVAVGAERLFARVAETGGRFELFKQVGFSPVVREYTYYRPLEPARGRAPADPSASAIPGLRPQHRSDAYGVLQLYQRCTPKVVQMAEGKQSRSWDLPAGRWGGRLLRPAGVRRWVVEREARLAAWLPLRLQRGGPHRLCMLVDDHAGDLHRPLVAFALAHVAARPAPGVLVSTREHQPSLLAALEDHGFHLIDGQLLMVKQLAAPVLRPQFAPALEKAV
jgi:hypothetical protein